MFVLQLFSGFVNLNEKKSRLKNLNCCTVYNHDWSQLLNGLVGKMNKIEEYIAISFKMFLAVLRKVALIDYEVSIQHWEMSFLYRNANCNARERLLNIDVLISTRKKKQTRNCFRDYKIHNSFEIHIPIPV